MTESVVGRVIGEVAAALAVVTAVCAVLVVAGTDLFDKISHRHTGASEIGFLTAVAILAIVGLIFALLGIWGHRKPPFRRGLSRHSSWRFWIGVLLIVLAGVGLLLD